MIDERHAHVSRLVLEAIQLDQLEREAFLEDACGSDRALYDDVASLLARADHSATWLDQPAVERWHEETIPNDVAGYRLGARLGSGGMGTVYRAEQERPRRSVALKLLRDGLDSDRRRQRFELEAELLGRLQHPSIAQIYEAGTATTQHGERPYFAMELVEGEDLIAHATRRALSLDARVALLSRIAAAVHHAHQRGIVHRDLKPSNVLVTADGVPKVLDFGIARALDHGAATTTRTGELLGTLAYMSPEQLLGGDVDVRSDVYAIGVVAYELLGGRVPIAADAGGLAEFVHAVCESVPPRLGTIDERLRGDLELVVARALEKDPDDRYPSVAALADDLDRVRCHEPVTAHPPRATYLLRRFAQRHRTLVGAAIAIVVILIGSTVAMGLLTVRAVDAETRAERRFNDVRALARVFLFDVYDRIADTQGTIEARRLLASTALVYLDGLAQDADDAALQREVVAGYTRLGDVLGSRLSAGHLGDTAGSLASYTKAEDLLDAMPASPDRDRLRAEVLEHRAALVAVRDEPRDSVNDIERAVALRQALVSEGRDRTALHGALELRTFIAAHLALRPSSRGEAAISYRESCRRAADAYAATLDPDERFDPWVFARLTADPLTAVERSVASAGREPADDPLANAERAVDARRAEAQAHPESAAAQHAHFESLMLVGRMYLFEGRPRDAIDAYRAATDIANELRRNQPRDRDALRRAHDAYVGRVEASEQVDPVSALDTAHLVHDLAVELGSPGAEGRALGRIAWLLLVLDRPNDALAAGTERVDRGLPGDRPQAHAALAHITLRAVTDDREACARAGAQYASALDALPEDGGSRRERNLRRRFEDLAERCAAGDRRGALEMIESPRP